MEKGASPSVNNSAGLSPLYYGLNDPFKTSLKFTKALLDAGADPLITGPNGETPLHLLAPSFMLLSPSDSLEYHERIEQSGDMTDYIAEYRTLYQRFIDSGWDRNSRDYAGNTPLSTYVKQIKYGDGYSYLWAACREGHEGDVRVS